MAGLALGSLFFLDIVKAIFPRHSSLQLYLFNSYLPTLFDRSSYWHGVKAYAQGITDIVRGSDLFAATHVHRLLQHLLDLPVPRWHHHELLLDEEGQKLAKRRGSPSLADRRLSGEDGLALAEQLRLQKFEVGS